MDAKQFRQALGNYGTGVALVSCLDSDNKRVAMTVNSFSSLSLDPPLVLWSIDLSSTRFEAFSNARYFCVNILSAQQEDISNLFSKSGNDQSEGLAGLVESKQGLPVAPESVASFDCESYQKMDVGDHQIIVGKVIDISVDSDQTPLLFFRGKYCGLQSINEE